MDIQLEANTKPPNRSPQIVILRFIFIITMFISFIFIIMIWVHHDHTRPSFKSKQVSLETSPLQLLHMDLFGPVNIQSLAGKRYIVVIVDEYSRISTFDEFFENKRFSQNLSTIKTFQHNGVAEQRNKTLIEGARSMLCDTKSDHLVLG
ncbi:hypothetical protein OSB04_023986 [Centaurea solstitialis]|uniref:Uncharacterized protein n=1 Tax=Centaurea solstitialis TaxID=347529 RepID=A0AA38WBM2_9ASTR|nr:hypothetical protein OSB04_023986 [Centaurea solstitialis]